MQRCPSLPCARELCLNSFRTCSRKPQPTKKFQKVSSFTTSSASRNAFAKGETDVISPRHEALTLLHKASKIVPAALDQKGLPPKSQIWDGILTSAHDDLSSAQERAVSVGVFPWDGWSQYQELVTALLADPLSSDEEATEALNERWKRKSGNHTSLRISNGHLAQDGSQNLVIPSGYLDQFPVPVEIIETKLPLVQASNDILLERVLKTDISIILVNPVTTSLKDIPLSELPSNTILILTSSLPQANLETLLTSQRQTLRQRPKHQPIRILSVDPKRAAQAVQLFHSNPSSLTAIQRYQDDVTGSQISSVTRAIHDILRQPSSSPIRTKLALNKIQDAFNASCITLHHIRGELDNAFTDATTLREKIDEESAKAHRSVFERNDLSPGAQKPPQNEVVLAIQQATKEMAHVMEHLTWWRMAPRVDEISSIVSSAVSRVWCRDLEKKLILHSGKLSALQAETTQSALNLLSTHTIVQSEVLKNDLLQIQASPRYQVSPESLTKPIYTRSDQIIEYPTTRLHIAGQKALISMFGGLVSGAGIGWAGWLGWLLGSGEGLLGFLGMDASTAIGVGALTAVGGLRWGVGKWEKAKKRWWQDWDRVGQGLERDLKTTLERTMARQVAIIGSKASNGILDAVKKREEELAESKRDLQSLQSTLDTILTKVSTKDP